MPAKRYFEFSEGSSNKFWEVWRDGVQVFTRYGKIGATGQVTVKKLGSDDEAKKLHDKLVGEKTGKGYVEGGGKTAAKPNGKGKAPAKEAASALDEVIEIPDGAYRLELIDKKTAKFWQIHRKDKTVTVTSGDIGTPGKVEKKKHKDEWEARSSARTQLQDIKAKGYQFVVAGPRPKPQPAATNPQLEAAIVKDPTPDAFMVYGDWLMEQNDPRGKMLAFKGSEKKQASSQAALAMKERTFFYGPLYVYNTASDKPACEASWKYGWMDTLHLSATRESWRDQEGPKPIPVDNCADLVRLLPKVTSARLLRELVIGSPTTDGEYGFSSVIKELVKAMPAMPNLRRLFIGDFDSDDCELSWSHLGSLKDFWKVAGKLEYLKIHCGSMQLGKIDAPELRELWIETGGFDKKNVDEIANANAPKLETLNLWFGQDNYGCDVEVKHLAALIEALPKKFPKLKHLGLANCTWGNEIAGLIVKSRILKQLESLDISMSHLTTQGLQTYVEAKDALKHLAKLDVSQCLLDNKGVKAAKALAKSVDTQSQEDPSDYQPDPEDPDEEPSWWRYSRVGE